MNIDDYPYKEMLPVFDFGFAACFTLKQFKTFDKKATELLPLDAMGMMYPTDKGTVVCVDLKDLDTSTLIMIIAHEATHVWQVLRDTISEQEASAEFEAYHIGYITQRIYDWSQEHLAVVATKKAKKTK